MGVSPAVRNCWPDNKCAKAFWSQQEVRPYKTLLGDTIEWCAPTAGERWLDLGCGGGPLSAALWTASAGSIAEVVGLDCAAINEDAYAKLRQTLTPPPGDRVRFECHNFSDGLAHIADDSFSHAVSGLSITYAESYSEAEERWTTQAYDTILAEVRRVIRPGGRFVFSVNVPEPSWFKVGVQSLGGLFGTTRTLEFLKRSLRMMKYGGWLKREARTGRFHYLPAEHVAAKLAAAGFEKIEHRLSYAKQAYVFRAHKPA